MNDQEIAEQFNATAQALLAERAKINRLADADRRATTVLVPEAR